LMLTDMRPRRLECKDAPVAGLTLGKDAPSFDENMDDIVAAMRAGGIDDAALKAEVAASSERLRAQNASLPPRPPVAEG